MVKKQPTAIPFEALCDGYRLTVLNAFDLLLASMCPKDQPSVGLAVAELGQEELGKSLSILVAVALPSEPEHWDWFWPAWRDHKRKAHRAFLYELISPVRLEGHSADGARLAGASMRDSLPAEKEVGFYIAYDEAQAKFVSPADAVGEVESYHRGLTVLYLGLTARAVALTLERAAAIARGTVCSLPSHFESAASLCINSRYRNCSKSFARNQVITRPCPR